MMKRLIIGTVLFFSGTILLCIIIRNLNWCGQNIPFTAVMGILLVICIVLILCGALTVVSVLDNYKK